MDSNTLILKVPPSYTPEQISVLLSNTRSQLPNHQIIVIPSDVEISYL
jgi:hypothetical protein